MKREAIIEQQLNGEWIVFEIRGTEKRMKAIYETEGEAQIAKDVFEAGGDESLNSLTICKR